MKYTSNSGNTAGASSGFTLLEVLFAVMVVGVAAIVVSRLQQNTWSGTRHNNARHMAVQLVGRQVETARFMIALDTAAYWPPTDSSYYDSLTGQEIAWTVSEVDDPWGSSIDRVRRLRYVVTWDAPQPESLVVVTMLSQQF